MYHGALNLLDDKPSWHGKLLETSSQKRSDVPEKHAGSNRSDGFSIVWEFARIVQSCLADGCGTGGWFRFQECRSCHAVVASWAKLYWDRLVLDGAPTDAVGPPRRRSCCQHSAPSASLKRRLIWGIIRNEFCGVVALYAVGWCCCAAWGGHDRHLRNAT